MEKSLIMIILYSVLIIGINDSQFAFAGVGFVDNDGDGVFFDTADPADSDPDDEDPCVPNQTSSACIGSHVIGGKIIPVDSTLLLLAGVQANYSILTALAVVGAGAGFAFLFFVDKLVCW